MDRNIDDYRKEKISIKTILLCLTIVFSFINNYKYGGGLSSIIIFILIYIFILMIDNTKLKFSINSFILFVFWIFFTVSTMLSPYTMVKQDTISFLIFVLFIVIATSTSFSDFDIRFLMNSYILTAIIGSINIIYNVSIDNQATWNRYSTSFFGVSKDPNYSSAFIIPAIMILLIRILYSKYRWNKWLLVLVLLIITFGVVSTGSRGAFIFVLFSYVYNLSIIIFNSEKNRIRMGIIVLLIAFFVIFSWRFLIDILPSSLILRMTQISSYTEDTTRLNIWKVGIDTFYERPIIGVGLNGANEYLVNRGYHNTHNVYLDIITGSGLLGSITLIVLFSRILKVRKNNFKYIFGIIVVMIGPLFFINGFNTPSFWIPIMLLLIISKHSNENCGPIPNWI